MARPEKFEHAFDLSYCILMGMYLPIAVVGYYVYGDLFTFNPILHILLAVKR